MHLICLYILRIVCTLIFCIAVTGDVTKQHVFLGEFWCQSIICLIKKIYFCLFLLDTQWMNSVLLNNNKYNFMSHLSKDETLVVCQGQTVLVNSATSDSYPYVWIKMTFFHIINYFNLDYMATWYWHCCPQFCITYSAITNDTQVLSFLRVFKC